MFFKALKLSVNNTPSDGYAVCSEAPEFSWSVESDVPECEICAYQIRVWDEIELLWDSGRVESTNSFSAYAGKTLLPGMRIRWELVLENGEGQQSDAVYGRFTVVPKKLDAPWITKANSRESYPIYLVKQFQIKKKVKRATIWASGIGYQKIYLNGTEAEKAVLQPAAANYQKHCYFTTIPVEQLLKMGRNCIGVILGDGWRRNFGEYLDETCQQNVVEFFGNPQLSLMLLLEYRDGSGERLCTDDSWYAISGGIIRENLFQGETYDARRERNGWNTPEYDYSGCVTHAIYAKPAGEILPQKIEPIREMRRIVPISKTMVAPGKYIFDFGENIAGYVEIKIPKWMKPGEKISMQFSEELDESGDLDMEYMRSATSLDEYISDGRDGGRLWKPSFCYHGFRYMRLWGWYGIPDCSDVQAIVVYSDVDAKNYFRCGSAQVNQIQENIVRGERCNLQGIATDCPQRDERMGWMNDATVRYEETPYNFNVSRLFPKILADIAVEQDESGAITCTAPYIYGNRPADPVCSSFLIAGWQCWLHYGNRRLLEEYYPKWCAWNQCIAKMAKDGIVSYSFYGDWAGVADSCISMEDPHSAVIPDAMMSTGFWYYNCCLLERIAEVLGLSEEKEKHKREAAAIQKTFLKQWYDKKTGRVASGTQGAQAFALWIGILPETQQAAERLHEAAAEKDFHFFSGNLTTRMILEMLTDYGYVDDAWSMMTKEDYPSFGYMIQNGATTIWERFELKKGSGMNSHNHPMYGAVGAWFYSRIAGLIPLEDGWRKFRIAPNIPSKLLHAEACIDTIRGEIRVKWFKLYGAVHIHINVPYGAVAEYRFGQDVKMLKHGFYQFCYEQKKEDER